FALALTLFVTPHRAGAQVTAMLPDVLKNLDYPSQFTSSGRAPLRDGTYDQRAALGTDAPRAVVTYVSSVANDDYGAAVLAANTGGSGIFVPLPLVRAQRGIASAGPGLLLGDRVRIEKMGISPEGECLVIDLVTQGPGDPLATPTKHETREYLPAGNS